MAALVRSCVGVLPESGSGEGRDGIPATQVAGRLGG